MSSVVRFDRPTRSSSLFMVGSASDRAVNSGKVSPLLSPEPRSSGPAPARITLGAIHFLKRAV